MHIFSEHLQNNLLQQAFFVVGRKINNLSFSFFGESFKEPHVAPGLSSSKEASATSGQWWDRFCLPNNSRANL